MRTNRVISALLAVILSLGLLTGCGKDGAQEGTVPQPVEETKVEVDEDGTTLLSEVDPTDESVFTVRYRREDLSVLEEYYLALNSGIRMGDAALLKGYVMEPEFGEADMSGYPEMRGLLLVDAAGELVGDYSKLCILEDGSRLHEIGSSHKGALLCYNEYERTGSNRDFFFARLSLDGAFEKLFHLKLGEDDVLTDAAETEDGICVLYLDSDTEYTVCISVFSEEGTLLAEKTLDGELNHLHTCGNKVFMSKIYDKKDAKDRSTLESIYPCMDIVQLDTSDFSFTTLASFDSGRIIGCDEDNVYVSDSSTVYRYDIQKGETSVLFTTGSLGIQIINWVVPLGDGDLLGSDTRSGRPYILRRELTTDKDNRTQIVLGTLNQIRSYEQAVLTFNRVQTEYKIVIRDYSKYPDPIQILNTELLAGSGPDILDVSELSADILRSGMLVDLLPYLEEDPEIDTGDFFPEVFECLKTDGQLLTAVPTYMIYSFVTREDNYPDGIDGLDEFIAAASEEGDYYRYLIGREEFLQTAFCSDTFESYTETDIANILRFSEALLTEADREELEKVSFLQKDFADRQQRLIDEGKQKMFLRKFGGTDSVIIEELALEKPLKPLGLPFAPKNTGLIIPAIELGITASSDVKEGAWQFIRELYLPSYQKQLGVMQYPISKSAYDATEQGRYDLWATGYSVTVLFGDRSEERMVYEPMGLSSAREVLTAPYGVYHRNDAVMSLVNSAAEEYYTGKTTAEDAAHVILSKLKIYFSERE